MSRLRIWSFQHLLDGTTGPVYSSMSVQAQTTCSTYDEIFNIHPEGDNLEQCFTAGICHSKVVGSTSINILRERMWYANWSIHAWALQSIFRAHTYIGSIMHNYSYREHTVYIESGLCLHTYFSPFTHPWLAAHWLGPAHVFVHGHSCGWTRSSAWTLQGLVPVWPVSANLEGRCVPHTHYVQDQEHDVDRVFWSTPLYSLGQPPCVGALSHECSQCFVLATWDIA